MHKDIWFLPIGNLIRYIKHNFSACDPEISCDWTACYDDIKFTRAVIKDVSKKYCIDLDSVHMTGLSNGGMFPYFAGTW